MLHITNLISIKLLKIIKNIEINIKMDESHKKFLFTQRIVLYILPIMAICGVITPLFFRSSGLSILGCYLAVPLFIAPLAFKRLKDCSSTYIFLKDRLFILLLNFYLILYFISILILFFNDIRPISYYIDIALISLVVLFEILLFNISKSKTIIILLQCTFLILNIIFGVTLKYFYFISRTDPISHAWCIEDLINHGTVTDAFTLYQAFPLWHILVSSVYIVSNTTLPIHKVMFFTNGITYAFILIVVYLLSLKIFKDKKIALICSLFSIFNPEIIGYGMGSIPRSIESFLLILLLLVYENSIPKKIISVILIYPLVIYHHVSMPFIISILALIYLLQKLYLDEVDKKFINLNYLALMGVITLSYWIYFSPDLVRTLFGNLTSPAPTGILTKSILNSSLNELFNYLHYTPLLFFLILGFFWAMQSERFLNHEKIFFISGLVLSFFSFPGPALLINKIAKNLSISRFGEYAFIFIILLVGYGFYKIFIKSNKQIKFLIITVAILMFLLTISNDFIASDNPLVKRPFYTYYITETEAKSAYHVAGIAKELVMSDYVMTRFLLGSRYELNAQLLELDLNNTRILRENNTDIILIRISEAFKRPLSLYTSESDQFEINPDWNRLSYHYLDSPFWISLEGYNKIFESNQVIAYS